MRSGFFLFTLVILLFSGLLSLSAQNNPFYGIKISNLPLSLEQEKEFYENYSPVILPEYFLLGTLHLNLMGRFSDGLKENQVDYYDYSEQPLVDYLRKIIQQQLNMNVSIEQEGEEINLYSVELAKKINTFFDEKGLLDMEQFDSKEKIYSFLLGAYYRRGLKSSENIYCIYMHYNNPIYFLLKEAECSKILFLSTKYRIPGSRVFYFEPPVSLKKYFDTIEKEKIALHKFLQKDEMGKAKKKDKVKKKEALEYIFRLLGEG